MNSKNDLNVSKNVKIKDAFEKLSKTNKKILFVISNKKLIGTLTDGDIRRYIIKGKNINSKITNIYNKKPYVIKFSSRNLFKLTNIMSYNSSSK